MELKLACKASLQLCYFRAILINYFLSEFALSFFIL